MDLQEACFHLRHRRRMYLPDDRYASVVAFVTGLASAGDGRMLDGFDGWVAERVLGHETGRGWWSVVMDSVPAGSPVRDADATTILLGLLEDFAERRPA
ncbi:hypothetical protein [Cellulomonas oligotrophica]|uniref:Uncharacterized protein n=1 Tax=Cellulomonas oligotrophica TaxID=931536 RepID=A0A7Y9FJC8_9CELL|nr:hypothetical protein [Cellulomonas oligotrophica]NYD88077.1 hypothetical protein [Cellulomonas oligotrophica]GIG33584.1 hypothetical protein Col01nite_27430 [Cellulomonas oligotrophica]